MADEVARLTQGKYVLLTTYRKDGRAVPTPVWVTSLGTQVVVWSATDTGKVKRIRRDGTVRLAPCTFGGEPLGDEVAGHAEILDGEGSERVRQLLARKYGILGRLTITGSKLRRGADGSVGIAITL